ncbi:hypothetical protein N7466_000872 [Penicillium verhagenii]|uniref:uncharacterized protein n=1 Tax=Penicillium verhagenii TaxID=1562060 RepID=UPI0025451049|nr:uncharacterized protein N7466_000872 [Penicillium verhagenii]KAJ5947857.1 hypothetical protein N7466_000872 [Penicillium verhagenii]
MRRGRPSTESESVDIEVIKSHAATAAARAMRSSGSSSIETKGSYDRLGGPSNVAIPIRRHNSSVQSTNDGKSAVAAHTAPSLTPRKRRNPDNNHAAQLHTENPAALPPITELKGLDGRDISVPSSYRRLRKAKSMFSTRQRLPYLTQNTPPMPHGSSPCPDFSPEFALPRTLRNSTSFTRVKHQGLRAIRHAKSQDVAIQLARDQYFKENESPEVQNRRSSFLLSRRKREQKPFRKTFRAPSDGSGPNPSPASFNSKLSHGKSRALSSSIKQGLRRVFGMTRHAEQPIEQSTCSLKEAKSQDFIENVPDRDDASLVSYSDGFIDVGKLRPSQSRQTSPSRASVCPTDSRCTSRAASVLSNTATTRKTGHRQSLSLIEEQADLDQGPSETPAHGNEKCQSSSRKRSTARNVKGWFNTQDLYTALMQQISQTATQDQEEFALGRVPEYQAVPVRVPSTVSHRSQHTVRCVSSEETSPESFATPRGGSVSPHKYQRSVNVVRPLRVVSRALVGHENIRPRSAYSAGKPPHFTYIVSGDSDEETGSVVKGHSMSKSESPTSVYSRTTGSNTPTKGDGILAALNACEPGTATIFASERTAWSSPSHINGSRCSMPVLPSADWQQWMSSQIERIEKASPTREHFREDAQFQDDDDVFTDMIRQTHVSGQVLTCPPFRAGEECDKPQLSVDPMVPQSNFSRPFSRSSSARTVLSANRLELEQPTEAPANNEIDPTANQSQAAPSWCGNIVESPVSMCIRSSNVIQIPESPTPPQRNGPGAAKRVWAQEQQSRRYSVRRPIMNGRGNSVRSLRSQRDAQDVNNENAKHGEKHDAMMDEYHNLQDHQSGMSGKRMVDMFLESRRHKMGKEPAGDENKAAGGAFI